MRLADTFLLTSASDLPMRTINVCYVLFGVRVSDKNDVEVRCHKQDSLIRGVSS